MELYPQTMVSFSNGTSSYDLERVRISILDAVGYIEAQPGQPPTYIEDAGDASFLLIGADGNYTAKIPVFTATAIEATISMSGEWSLQAFDLEYADINDDCWQISVPASTWD